MKLKIEVTREDLDNGMRNESQNCPIALATKRALREVTGLPDNDIQVMVDGDINFEIEPRPFEIQHFYLHDKENEAFVGEFVTRYDNEDFVSPFVKEMNFVERVPDYDRD